MKPGRLAISLLIAASVACGGNSATTPSAPSNPSPNPSPSVRGTWVDAPPMTVGTLEGNPNVGNTNPFGGPPGPRFPGTTYQQVYLGSLFGSDQVRLTSVEYFATAATVARGVVSANYSFSLSTISKAVDALDTVNLASNVGANQQVVFNGALGGALVNAVLQITFSNSFTFTPGNGNLLLQVVRSNPGPNTMVAFWNHRPNDGFPSGLSSRASDFSDGHAGNYLITRFNHQRCQCPTDAPCSC